MKRFLLSTFVAGFLAATLNAQTNQTVTGNLQVNGTTDLEGNLLTIGSWAGDPTSAGLAIHYAESSGVSVISFDASRDTNTWLWRHEGLSGTIETMRLGSDHVLTLLQADCTTAGVVLDPDGSSTFAGSLVISGTDSRLPNQTLTGAGSIITQGLGDARYLRQGSVSLAYGSGSSATSGYSIAGGLNAVAEGGASNPSIALGSDVTTTVTTDGRGSIAIGWGSEAGNSERGNAVAIGTDSKALGDESLAFGLEAEAYYFQTIAMGHKAKANRGNAIAIGSHSEATGFHGVALGRYTLADGFAQLAVGTFNAADPNTEQDVAVPEGNIFVVGNGNEYTGRSNAFEVKWNGNARVAGDLEVNGTIRVEPKGGISMGEFTHDPNANP